MNGVASNPFFLLRLAFVVGFGSSSLDLQFFRFLHRRVSLTLLLHCYSLLGSGVFLVTLVSSGRLHFFLSLVRSISGGGLQPT